MKKSRKAPAAKASGRSSKSTKRKHPKVKEPRPAPGTPKPSVSTSDIIAIFEEMAGILEVLGENPFRARSYQTAARALESLPGDLAEMAASGELLEVKGIGKSLFAHIVELIDTGELREHGELRKKVPDGVLDMLLIPGMGPKKVKAVYEKLGIESIDQLEQAARQGKIAGLEGFGAKSQEKMLASIESVRKYSARHLLSRAIEEADAVFKEVEKYPGVKRSILGGSLRRFRETIKDIDILVSADEAENIMERFTTLPRVASVVAKGPTKSSVTLRSGMNADLRVVSDEQFPYASLYFTGSKEHNTLMRGRAKRMGYKLNEYGLFKGDKLVRCRDEAAVFEKLGLDYIPPELREAAGEIEAAEGHTLPDLVTERDVRGILHVHTTYSDGAATIKQMAEGTRALDMRYLGIADHSRTAVYANGLSIAKVEQQAEEVKLLGESMSGFRLFHGIESDILPDGSLDYPDEILDLFDFVVASVHSAFGLSETAMTERIIKAIENPYTTILGHPTGRLLLSREGYNVDMNALIDAAARTGVVIEINCHPTRLDLDWRFGKIAKEKGVKIAICPDSHTVKGIEDYRYGVAIARKGWLTKDDILNTKTAAEVDGFFRSRRKR